MPKYARCGGDGAKGGRSIAFGRLWQLSGYTLVACETEVGARERANLPKDPGMSFPGLLAGPFDIEHPKSEMNRQLKMAIWPFEIGLTG